MHIGIVGGVERNERDYHDVAARFGHELTFHSGHVGGRGSHTLVDLVVAVDLLIVVTDVNSHGAVLLARKTARRCGRALELYRRFSPSRLAARVAALLEGPAP